MRKYCPENEKKKRDYAFFLEAANGKQDPTIDAALRAIERFELSTGHKAFRKFHIEQARSFRAGLIEERSQTGKPLSPATIASTLKHLRNFFLWLSREPGFRSAINANDANYFTPSDQDMRVATARREKHVATLDEIKRVLALMPAQTAIERRNRALIAFTILTGARDGALASIRLKHVNMTAQTVFHDGREVRTKGRKTFTSSFFPVGPEPVAIIADYIAMLTGELGFGPDDPLFPATRVGHGEDRGFEPQGLSRAPWSTAAPTGKFSARPSRRRACHTSILTLFETRWRASASAYATRPKNGRPGAKISAMKARRRLSWAMATCRHIGRRKSCGRWRSRASRSCRTGWTWRRWKPS